MEDKLKLVVKKVWLVSDSEDIPPDTCSFCGDEWNGVNVLEIEGFPKSDILICRDCLFRRLKYKVGD